MASAIPTTKPSDRLEEPRCTTPTDQGTKVKSRHPFGTPAPHKGFHFREAPEGSLQDLADRAQGLFSQALDLLERDLLRAQQVFSEGQKLLTEISAVIPTEISGSDGAILTELQRTSLHVDRTIKSALTTAATG